MENIIAGRLQQQEQVQQAIDQLIDAGFTENKISSFYVNPAGQHDLYPIGGDRDESPGAKETETGIAVGVTAGGAIGASVGVAGIPVAGPVAPVIGGLVGAYVGSLIGSLSEMKEVGESEIGGENAVPQRKAGMVVAVSAPDAEKENSAIAILKSLGADQIEHAQGTIVDGDWQDFNPLAVPLYLGCGEKYSPQRGV